MNERAKLTTRPFCVSRFGQCVLRIHLENPPTGVLRQIGDSHQYQDPDIGNRNVPFFVPKQVSKKSPVSQSFFPKNFPQKVFELLFCCSCFTHEMTGNNSSVFVLQCDLSPFTLFDLQLSLQCQNLLCDPMDRFFQERIRLRYCRTGKFFELNWISTYFSIILRIAVTVQEFFGLFMLWCVSIYVGF